MLEEYSGVGECNHVPWVPLTLPVADKVHVPASTRFFGEVVPMHRLQGPSGGK